MAELPNAAREPSEILDLAAVQRPMQQRVHIVVQVDWFQIAEKFLPRPDEETDIRDLTVAVMTTEEELNFYIDMTKQIIASRLALEVCQRILHCLGWHLDLCCFSVAGFCLSFFYTWISVNMQKPGNKKILAKHSTWWSIWLQIIYSNENCFFSGTVLLFSCEISLIFLLAWGKASLISTKLSGIPRVLRILRWERWPKRHLPPWNLRVDTVRYPKYIYISKHSPKKIAICLSSELHFPRAPYFFGIYLRFRVCALSDHRIGVLPRFREGEIRPSAFEAAKIRSATLLGCPLYLVIGL